ncbi:MAG: HlyC/CorC family transporter [bacterium]|nr:HlyC/CorC family transporter [bacterium]
MTNVLWLKLASFAAFILISAFFSSAETAFTAISRLKLRNLLEQKVKGSKQLHLILQNPKKLITAILIGNNITNVGASALATSMILDFLESIGITNFATSMSIVTGITTFIILTFGEITPKTIAIKKPEKLGLIISKPIYALLVILHPVIIFFTYLSKGISRLLGLSSTEVGKILTAEEIKTIVKIGEEEGILEKEEKEMIHSIFEFSETIVREIMTPRTDTVCIDVKSSVSEAIQLIQDKGHSRIPVFEEKIDNILGIAYAKDLLGVHDKNLPSEISIFMRKAVFIPETANIEDLLHQMKKAKIHIAIVVDEYGGMSGLVTLEDIIEEIVGEIQDEYDKDEKPEFIELKNGHYLVEASININSLGEKLNCSFPEDEDYDTLGGFVLSELGKFPSKNEKIAYKNIDIIVKDIYKRRILQLEIFVKKAQENQSTTNLGTK